MTAADRRLRLALYQPDIPQNTGTILRMAACLGVGVDVIMPAGFDMTDRSLRRAGLDYLDHVDLVRHADWEAFRREAGVARGGSFWRRPEQTLRTLSFISSRTTR